MKVDPLALQAERRILLIRQHRVMLDYDLATLYGVEARALNQAVKRNLARFPDDFMFQLTEMRMNGFSRCEITASALTLRISSAFS